MIISDDHNRRRPVRGPPAMKKSNPARKGVVKTGRFQSFDDIVISAMRATLSLRPYRYVVVFKTAMQSANIRLVRPWLYDVSSRSADEKFQ